MAGLFPSQPAGHRRCDCVYLRGPRTGTYPGTDPFFFPLGVWGVCGGFGGEQSKGAALAQEKARRAEMLCNHDCVTRNGAQAIKYETRRGPPVLACVNLDVRKGGNEVACAS
uniref:Uncharacterized protein n=1 Tax=Chromera velia CCMP2878 TaxID=1169474 RepID=A0A0G4F2U6_9ALVE|eukprot:Cvel_14955.t1-p1 / transcript=Cvel_14955.t1 / gene=Cvel_14955 / organism=Chromera_velia_CCMP2878 / gene_product=hypothetical protein / transcript_product=hypothetical protein / location=Cvel_scaffold1085:39566-39898(+) / protein_length=111 / sequence_SO=supercontig / SO=protein_coding / is_pseudo=false